MKIGIVSAVLTCMATVAAQSAEFDIAGMKLGMNAEQVATRYQEIRPKGEYQFTKWKLPEGSEWVANGMTLYNDRDNPDDMESERMEFAFTGLGSGNKLFAVERELKFRPSKRPSTDAVYAAAVKKYGEPSYLDKSESKVEAVWKFDAANAPAQRIDGQQACIGRLPVGLDDSTAERAKERMDYCGLYIEFHVYGDEAGLAQRLDMSMMNYLDLVRDFDADNQDARARINAARLKNANEAAPVPDL